MSDIKVITEDWEVPQDDMSNEAILASHTNEVATQLEAINVNGAPDKITIVTTIIRN